MWNAYRGIGCKYTGVLPRLSSVALRAIQARRRVGTTEILAANGLVGGSSMFLEIENATSGKVEAASATQAIEDDDEDDGGAHGQSSLLAYLPAPTASAAAGA